MYQIKIEVDLNGVDGTLTLTSEVETGPVDMFEAHAKALATQLHCKASVLQAGDRISYFDYRPSSDIKGHRLEDTGKEK